MHSAQQNTQAPAAWGALLCLRGRPYPASLPTSTFLSHLGQGSSCGTRVLCFLSLPTNPAPMKAAGQMQPHPSSGSTTHPVRGPSSLASHPPWCPSRFSSPNHLAKHRYEQDASLFKALHWHSIVPWTKAKKAQLCHFTRTTGPRQGFLFFTLHHKWETPAVG